MNTIRAFSLTLILSISFSQDQMGLGFEFHSMPSSLMQGWLDMDEGQGIGVYFPFKTSGILIEPEISLYKSTTEMNYTNFNPDIDLEYSLDYTIEKSATTISVGVFKIFNFEKSNFYAGARIGQIKLKDELDYKAPQLSENDEENESEVFSFAPTVGAEFFISDVLSIGGEAMYVSLTSENDNYDGGSSLSDEEQWQRTDKTSYVLPKLMIRFYFSK